MMAKHIRASDIPMSKRLPHLKRYRAQLRDALLHPALTNEQRAEIRKRLSELGKPRVYKGNPVISKGPTPPVSKPTTTSPSESSPPAEPEEPVVGETLDDLLALSKGDLLALAAKEGAEAKKSWNKTEIATAILGNRQGT